MYVATFVSGYANVNLHIRQMAKILLAACLGIRFLSEYISSTTSIYNYLCALVAE